MLCIGVERYHQYLPPSILSSYFDFVLKEKANKKRKKTKTKKIKRFTTIESNPVTIDVTTPLHCLQIKSSCTPTLVISKIQSNQTRPPSLKPITIPIPSIVIGLPKGHQHRYDRLEISQVIFEL